MAEERLDDAQVGAAGQQMGRERMAEHVREDARAEARGERTPPDDLPDRLARQGAAAAADEDEGARPAAKLAAARRAEVRLERFPRRPADGDDALLPALARHGDEPRLQVQLLAAQRGELRHAEAARIEQLEQRAVAEPGPLLLAR